MTAALNVAGALSGCDEADLLARARRGLRTAAVARGDARDKLPTAMALALLRPLRLLTIAGMEAPLVADVPFVHVDRAARACVQLADTPPGWPLRRWLADSGLTPWCADQAAWQADLARARGARRTATPNELAELARGRSVAVVCTLHVHGGPLDGALTMQVIFDDASVLNVPTGDPAAARRSLLHRRDRLQSPLEAWLAAHASKADEPLMLWQPSPLNATTSG
jgi:hypothetical protein